MATDPTNIRFINPSTLATPPGYTHVVEITQGRTVFIAGQVALDQSGKIVGQHDFRAQTQQVFENLKAALAAVGTDFTRVVKLNMYVVDISQLQTLREVRWYLLLRLLQEFQDRHGILVQHPGLGYLAVPHLEHPHLRNI